MADNRDLAVYRDLFHSSKQSRRLVQVTRDDNGRVTNVPLDGQYIHAVIGTNKQTNKQTN